MPTRPKSACGRMASLPISPALSAATRESLDLPGPRRRQRTCSTSASISTERDTVIRTQERTIYTAGRPPWYDYKGEVRLLALHNDRNNKTH